jgi:TolB-like protein/Flp pilus assembly protein TadD
MADIFIGYARLNREKAERLAAALEASGFSVWWDRQIVGGAEFSRDIEHELDAAKAVIIAWSGQAGNSPWVKDEAEVAREQNKLVPISLDQERPPMGFRQYQAIDFSGWNGEADSPEFESLIRAVKARIAGVGPQIVAQRAVAVPRKPGRRVLYIAALLLAALAIFAVFNIRNAPPLQDPTLTAVTEMLEPRIAVGAIGVRGDDPVTADLAAALSEDIASGLARFSYLLVTSGVPESSAAGPGARYLLKGTLQRADSTLRLTTQLIDVSSGEQIWGETFDRAFDVASVLQIQDNLTDHVVSSVADPYGALMRDLSRDVAPLPPQDMTPYQTVLRHFVYRQRISPGDHRVTRDALERAARISPDNANVQAALAAMYSEEYKHNYNVLPGSLDRALATARHAVELEPDNAYAQFVLAEVYFFRQDVGAFKAAAERATALNPRDSDALAMIGIMLGYSGDWERSVELTMRAMALNPNHPGWYRFSTFFNEYQLGNYEGALDIALRINMPEYFPDAYTRALAYAQLGRDEAAARALGELKTLWPAVDIQAFKPHLYKWFYAQPELYEQILEGLRKAGLE